MIETVKQPWPWWISRPLIGLMVAVGYSIIKKTIICFAQENIADSENAITGHIVAKKSMSHAQMKTIKE